jgi:hypothetical protein
MLKVEKAAMDIVGQLAKERGANMVVLKQAVVFSPDSSDITTEVLSRLDKNMAAVQVNLPKIEGGVTTSRRERRSSRQQQ